VTDRVYTGGTFDLFHVGHVRFLAKCAELGRVIVSLNDDDFITEFKGHPPVIPYEQRREVLQACRYVAEVIPNFGGSDSRPAIDLVDPDIIAIGSDWQQRDYYAQMGFTPEWLANRGITLVYLPYTVGVSSSAIRERL
jgi:glycerol-3-phosphate cytidylyltransferase